MLKSGEKQIYSFKLQALKAPPATALTPDTSITLADPNRYEKSVDNIFKV